MTETHDSDPLEEIGGVPVDEEIGGLPPDAPDSSDPVEPQIPASRKSKTRFRSITAKYQSPKRSRTWMGCLVLGVVLFCCLCWLLCCGILAAAGGVAAVMKSNEVTQDGALRQVVESTDDTGAITLSVDNPTGQVRIRPGDTDEVRVDYTKKAYGFSKDQSQSGLDDINVALENPGGADRFVLTVDKSGDLLRSLDHVNLMVYVPQDVHLVVDTNTGEIDVQDVTVRSMDLKANTGAVIFEGTLASDPDATFHLETNTGGIVVRLPRDADVRIDASANTGGVDVASTFDNVVVESRDDSGPSQSWTGYLGEGSSDAPALTLHSNTGGVVVESR